MENTELELKKRFEELSNKAYSQGAYYFTDFLSMSDAAILYDTLNENDFTVFGGANGCERVMAKFGNASEFGYDQDFPILVIKAEPLILKFADDLNHRDFLGALMNLGIKREVVGDIVIQNKTALIFTTENMASYIAENFDKVKHTNIKCQIMTTDEVSQIIPYEKEMSEIIVASDRLDAVLSKIYNLSRSQSIEMFRAHKVFVNGRLYENNSGVLKEGAVVSVRGYGKFIYKGVKAQTRKGKLNISIEKYI